MNNGNEKSNCYTYVDGAGFAKPTPDISEKKIIKEYSSDLAWIVLLNYGAMLLLPFLLFRFISRYAPIMRFLTGSYAYENIAFVISSIVSYVLPIALPILLFALLLNVPPRVALPFAKISLGDTLLMLMMTLAIGVIGSYSDSSVQRIIKYFSLESFPQDPYLQSWHELISFLIIYLLLIPIIEELCYHGVVLQSLRRFGDRFAIVVSSFIYALSQFNISTFLSSFALSLVVGYFILRTNSLRTGLIIHALTNLIFLTSDLACSYLPSKLVGPASNLFAIIFLILGIAGFLAMSKRYKNFFYLNQTKAGPSNHTKLKWFFFCPTTIIITLIILSFSVSPIYF